MHTEMAGAVCQLLATGLTSALLVADSLQTQPYHQRRQRRRGSAAAQLTFCEVWQYAW